MLNETERRQIKRLLGDHFTMADLRRLVTDASQDFESVVHQNANKPDAIMDILDGAERNGWVTALLEKLTVNLEARLSSPLKETAVRAVRDILDHLKVQLGRGTALGDPFNTCFVRGGWPYVNRPNLRKAFATLAETGGLRIAVVNGPPGSGKTYSKELPQFVAEVQQYAKFKVYYKDVSEGAYAITADKLAQSILNAWSVESPIPAQLSQSSSYATELSEWLASKVPKGETWWIVVDGLAQITPDRGLLDFLMALAGHIADTPHALRLVLLDLGDQNTLPVPAEQMATKVKIGPMTTDDLVDHFFRTLHMANAAPNPFDPKLMLNKAQNILGRITGGQGPAKLREILLEEAEALGFR
jgi:hypothetical protein